MGEACEFGQVDVLREGHAPRVDLEDLQPPVAVGDPDLDLAVEAPRPAQGRVEGVRPVRRADDHDLPAGLQSVHERKELRDHPSLDLAGDLVPLRCDAVQFVDEDDARGVFLGLLEDVSEVLLALSVEFGHDLGARDRMEVRVRLRGDGLREQGLPGPRRAMEEDALRRLDAEPLEQLRMAQREFDHLADLPDLGAEPADVLVVDLRDLRPFLFRRLLRDLDFRARFDEDGVGSRRERRNDELELATHHAHAQDIPARDDASLEDLDHVLLPAHDPDRLRRREGHLLGRSRQGLLQADLVVDPHPGVAALHPVHADHPAVRVLGISAAHAGGGGLRAQDQDDVAFLQIEDLHDLGIQVDDPAARVGGLRFRDPEELLTARGHRSQAPAPSVGTEGAALRNETGLLEVMSKPAGIGKKGKGCPFSRRAP